MDAGKTIVLPKKVSELKHGLVFVWSYYANGEGQNGDFNYIFVPKSHVALHSGCGVSMFLCDGGDFNYISAKYIYINNNCVYGHNVNMSNGTGSSGIKYDNTKYVLRYIIGI